MNTLTYSGFRSPIFDHFFISFIPVLAIITAYIVYFFPEYFQLIFTIDLFFLGYHHVISTYTRLSQSNLEPKEFQFLVYYLPIIVLIAVATCALLDSVWLIPTIYLHWQWWHYTRQSEGVAKSIRFKTKSTETGNETFNRFVFYLVPITAFIIMSARQHPTFLFMPVYTVPVPMMFANFLSIFTACVWSVWFVTQMSAVTTGKVSVKHFLYLLSHHVIYVIAYVLIGDISIGWLAINIWHNLQYISFVWHFNTNKFKGGVSKENLIVSWMSQPGSLRFFVYFSVCLISTYIFYSVVDLGISVVDNFTILPLTVIAYQTINFHHYIVDSQIWKIRKPAIRNVL